MLFRSEKYKHYSIRIGSKTGVKFNALKARIFDNEGLNAKNATKKFIEWVKAWNPDIIHLHNLHGYYLNINLLFNYLKTCGKKILYTLHDCWTFTGHCAHFMYSKCDRWKFGCKNCPEKKAYPASLLKDNSMYNYLKKRDILCNVLNMTIITPSEWLANLVKQSYLLEYPVKVINNGIDLNVFKPTQSDFRSKYGLENKKVILGVASVWTDKKGFFDFLKLSRLLDDSYRIVLVGVNEKQKKVLPKNIIGITRTDTLTDLAGIYTAADVFVNLTYEDTYPTVNLEAQACGTPVITYATGGSVESVPSENVVPIGDIDSWIYKDFAKLHISPVQSKLEMLRQYEVIMNYD